MTRRAEETDPRRSRDGGVQFSRFVGAARRRALALRPPKTINSVVIGVGAGLILVYTMGLIISHLVTLTDLQRSRYDGTVEQARFEDYVAFYAAGRLVLDGEGSSIYDLDVLGTEERSLVGRNVGGAGTLAFFNPPFVALIYSPLALLPLATAGLVLILLNVVLVAAAGMLMYRLVKIRSGRMRVVFWLGVLSFEPALWVIGQGQLSMFLVFGFLGFFVFERQGKPRLSGLSLALLLVKPQMALIPLFLMLGKRQWEALGTFLTVAGILVIVSLAVASPAALWEYPSFLLESAKWEDINGVDTETGYGWFGFFATLTPKASFTHLMLAGLATMASLLSVLVAFRGQWRPESTAFPSAVAVLILATVLTNPHIYLQDMVTMGLVIVLGVIGSRKGDGWRPAWLALSVATSLLLSRSLWLQYDFNLNLVTPLCAALLFALVARTISQRSTELEKPSKRSMYGKVPERRVAA